MRHRTGMIHDLESSALALSGNALQTTAEYADAIAQQAAIGRIMNVALDYGGVGPDLAALGNALLTRDLHYPGMNLLGDRGTQYSKQAAEGAVGGRGLGIVVSESPVDKIAAQFAFQVTEAPGFEVLEHAAAQQAIRRNAGAASARGQKTTSSQILAN